MATLYIDKSDSSCGACGKGADPYEESHMTVMGWFARDGRPQGCGEVFDAVDSHYNWLGGMKEAIRDMRPDLPWIGAPRNDPYKAPEFWDSVGQ